MKAHLDERESAAERVSSETLRKRDELSTKQKIKEEVRKRKENLTLISNH